MPPCRATAGGLRVAGPPDAPVRRVAVAGGAGDDLFDAVRAQRRRRLRHRRPAPPPGPRGARGARGGRPLPGRRWPLGDRVALAGRLPRAGSRLPRRRCCEGPAGSPRDASTAHRPVDLHGRLPRRPSTSSAHEPHGGRPESRPASPAPPARPRRPSTPGSSSSRTPAAHPAAARRARPTLQRQSRSARRLTSCAPQTALERHPARAGQGRVRCRVRSATARRATRRASTPASARPRTSRRSSTRSRRWPDASPSSRTSSSRSWSAPRRRRPRWPGSSADAGGAGAHSSRGPRPTRRCAGRDGRRGEPGSTRHARHAGRRCGDDLVALYEKIRAPSGGLGAAALRQRRCGGCRLELEHVDMSRDQGGRARRGRALRGVPPHPGAHRRVRSVSRGRRDGP